MKVKQFGIGFYTEILVITNKPVPAHLIIKCEVPMTVVAARVMGGGPPEASSFNTINSTSAWVNIPAPDITPQDPLLILLESNAKNVGTCVANPL